MPPGVGGRPTKGTNLFQASPGIGIGKPTGNQTWLGPPQNVKQQLNLGRHDRVVRQQNPAAASDGVGTRAKDRLKGKQMELAGLNRQPRLPWRS